MKVKIKDLKPNPFRRLKTYPIDQARVERLRQSIKHTGFWDNIVGRKKNGKVEIAYGHHRLIALQKEYSKDYEVDVIIKPLDDIRMIQVMADENDDLYKTTPAVINETVKVARDYIKEHADLEKRLRREIPARTKDGILRQSDIVSGFLNWDYVKVEEALASLKHMEKDVLIKEEYEKFKSQSQALEFRQARKKYPKVSDKVAKEIAKDVREDKLAIKDIKDTFKNEGFKKEKESPDYLDFLIQLIPKIRDLARKLDEVAKFKKHIQGERGYRFLRVLEELIEVIKKFKGGNENGKKKNICIVEENRRLLGTARR